MICSSPAARRFRGEYSFEDGGWGGGVEKNDWPQSPFLALRLFSPSFPFCLIPFCAKLISRRLCGAIIAACFKREMQMDLYRSVAPLSLPLALGHGQEWVMSRLSEFAALFV